MNAAPNTIGVVSISRKTGKVCTTNRGPRDYFVRVTDSNGQSYRGKQKFDSELAAVYRAGALLRTEGLPNSWDADVLPLHYIAL